MSMVDPEAIRSASLTIESDGFNRLEYRIDSGQVVAALGTYGNGIMREDLETTLRLEPRMVVLPMLDLRNSARRRRLIWYEELTKNGKTD